MPMVDSLTMSSGSKPTSTPLGGGGMEDATGELLRTMPSCSGMDVQHVATVVHLWRSSADEKYAGSERYEI